MAKRKKRNNRKKSAPDRQAATLPQNTNELMGNDQTEIEDDLAQGERLLNPTATPSSSSNVQRKSLRFMEGDDVVFRRPDARGWHAGTVTERWYRHAKWDDKKPPVPYLVEQKSPLSHKEQKKMVHIECDTDACIRVLRRDKSPKVPVLAGDIPLPEPRDPLSFLYQGQQPPGEDFDQEENQTNDYIAYLSNLKSFNEEGAYKLGILPTILEGGGQLCSRTLRDSSSTLTRKEPWDIVQAEERNTSLFLPEEPDESGMTMYNIPISWIQNTVLPRVSMRRPVEDLYKDSTPEEIVKSLLPEESSLSQLESNISSLEKEIQICEDPWIVCDLCRKRCKKLLNLGDVLLFLFEHFNCERDFRKAVQCYKAAGSDLLPSDNYQSSIASRMEGLPEAMVMEAVLLHYSTERMVYALLNGISVQDVPQTGFDRPFFDMNSIFQVATQDRGVFQNILLAVECLNAALVNHGYVSRLAFEMGTAFNNLEVSKILKDRAGHRHQDAISRLQQAHRNNQIRNQIYEEKMRNPYVESKHGVPRSQTLDAFAPKALDILRNIPVHGPSGNVNLFVSLFELDLPTSPLCVFLACPEMDFVNVLRIPDELQLFPFSKAVFRWIWLRIAFAIHIGLDAQNEFDDSPGAWVRRSNPYSGRVRPQAFKILNRQGDGHLASYLQSKCFHMPGTKVEFLDNNQDDIESIDENESGINNLWQLYDTCTEDHDYPFPDDQHWRRAQRIAKSLEETERHRSQHMMIFSRLKPDGISTQTTTNSASSILDQAYGLKRSANRRFQEGDYAKAKTLYERALSVLREMSEPTTQALEQAGVLFSNLAICGLEMAKSQDPDVGAFFLKQVEGECSVILQNKNILATLQPEIISKLQFRKELAASRQPEVDPEFFIRRDEIRGDTLAYHFDTQYNLSIFDKAEEMIGNIKIMKGIETANIVLEGELEVMTECLGCGGSFDSDLADKLVVQYGCTHLSCAQCLLKWKGANNEKLTCWFCQKEMLKSSFDEAIENVFSAAGFDQIINDLPLVYKAERIEIARAIAVQRKLDIDQTREALEQMTLLAQQGTELWRNNGDLTPEAKQEIFNEARLPVEAIESEYNDMKSMLESLPRGKLYNDTAEKVASLEKKLATAKENAGKEVYYKINHADGMGRANSQGAFVVDFHGLTAAEAKEKTAELVAAFLPVCRTIFIITGRGNHSAKGPVVKSVVQRLLARGYSDEAECHPVEGNPGALRVSYIANSDEAAGLD